MNEEKNERDLRWPDIDIIIPTLNCEKDLKICLSRIRSQKYDGNINIYVIDGGSIDGTIKIAQDYDCILSIQPGVYSDGNGGAKMIGDKMSHGDFVMHIDSDNFLEGTDVLRSLALSLINNSECNLSIPFPSEDLNIPEKKLSKINYYLNKYITMKELKNLNYSIKKGLKRDNCFYVKDLEYGLTNCTMIRRKALEIVDYFDNDIETLKRLRKKGLATACLVPNAKFTQYFSKSFMKTVLKQVSRIKFFSNMDLDQLKNYFIEKNAYKNHFKIDNLKFYMESLKAFLRTRNKEDLYFISYLILNLLVLFYSFPYLIKLYLKIKFS